VTLTFATLCSEQRAGTVHVSREAFAEMVASLSARMLYAHAPLPDDDGDFRFYGPCGLIRIRVREELTGDEYEWADLDVGGLVQNIAQLGGTYFRGQRQAKRPAAQKCSYCGAPGQRIGTRCEYCQVAVSR
jgi:hypothetical protein